MNVPSRLGLYGLALAVAFAGAWGVGRLAGPQARPAAHPTDSDHAAADAGDADRAGASRSGRRVFLQSLCTRKTATWTEFGSIPTCRATSPTSNFSIAKSR